MRLLMITALAGLVALPAGAQQPIGNPGGAAPASPTVCLLYTSDAADE